MRTHEIGIRTAIGATRSDILKLIVGHGLLLMGIGLILGLGGSAAIAQFLASVLHEVSPTDPSVFLGVVALLFVVLFLAAYVPARRVVGVDPMVALRHE